MKKTIGWILSAAVLCTLLLAGCGEQDRTRQPEATKAPAETTVLETVVPDTENGTVKEDDGILTDEKTANATNPPVTNDMDTSKSTDTQQQSADTVKNGK